MTRFDGISDVNLTKIGFPKTVIDQIMVCVTSYHANSLLTSMVSMQVTSKEGEDWDKVIHYLHICLSYVWKSFQVYSAR